MFAAYRNDNDGLEFKFIHVFSRIEMCDKWTDVRTDLGKNGTYDPNAPPPAASEGRPIGNKKAKAERAKEPMVERLHTAVEKCIADAAATAAKKDELHAKREEAAAARWTMIMEKQNVKLTLLKTNVAAKKRAKDLELLMVNTDGMDPEVMAWYAGVRKAILSEAAAPSTPTSATPTPAVDSPSPASTTSTTTTATAPVTPTTTAPEAPDSSTITAPAAPDTQPSAAPDTQDTQVGTVEGLDELIV